MALHLSADSEAQPLGQAQAESIEQGGLGTIGTDDAAQAQLAIWLAGGGQDDVGALDGAEFLKNGPWAVAEAGAALPLLERLPQHVGQEADQDVRQDAVFALMPQRGGYSARIGRIERSLL